MMPELVIFKQKIRDICREAAFALHGNVVKRTPIDTGRARSSWNLNEGEADPSVTPALRDVINPSTGAIIEKAAPGASPLTDEQAGIAAATQQQKIGPGAEVIVISNNLPYIEALEHGHSKQAPAGMFAVSFTRDEVELALKEAAAANRI